MQSVHFFRMLFAMDKHRELNFHSFMYRGISITAETLEAMRQPLPNEFDHELKMAALIAPTRDGEGMFFLLV